MGSTLADLLIGIGFQTSASSIASVQNDAAALKNTLSKMFSVVGITLTLSGVKNFIQDVSSTAAEVKAINTQFQNTFRGIEETATESLNNVSEATGISATRMKQTYTSLASYLKTTGMSANEANEYASTAMYEIANNAAYMDTTLEEAAGYFIKMSKGNYTVDDRMNFDFMQDSRDELAQELYGKNFSDLSKYEQEVALLEKLKRANRDMGAIIEEENYSQAAFEAGQYTNQVGELADAMKMLKVAVGNIFLEPLLRVQTKMASVIHEITEELGDAEDETSMVARASTALTKIVDKGIAIFDKGCSVLKRFVSFVGGTEQALKLLGFVIAAIGTVMLVDKIQGVAKALAAVNWKLVGIIAIIAVIFAVIQDVYYFIMGYDSATGELLKKMGIDPDDARQKVNDFKNEIQQGIQGIVDYVSPKLAELKEPLDKMKQSFDEAMAGLGEVFGEFWDEHGDQIQKMIDMWADWVAECEKFKFDSLIDGLESLIETLGRLFDVISKVTQGDFKGAIESAVGAVSSGIDSAASVYDANPLGGIAKKAITGINDATGLSLPTSFSDAWNKAKDAMKDAGISAEGISDGVMAAKDAYDELKQASEENAQKILDGANAAEEGANQASTAISGMKANVESDMTYLGSSSYQWGYDMGANFASGLNSSPLQTALNAITQNIKDNVGHSKPKKGPLADDDKWMPDMMQNFIKGINSQKGQLKSTVNGIANMIKGNEDGLMALGQTATVGMAAGSSRNINVTQNISYANTFNGDTRSNQVKAAGQMKSNADDTSTYLANAIAFGR